MTAFTNHSMLHRIWMRTLTRPPSHFSNPARIPSQFGVEEPTQSPLNPTSETTPDVFQGLSGLSDRSDKLLKEFLSLFAMVALAYLAIDNYMSRIKLEKLNTETTSINLKTLQLQQQNFLNARKQQELKMLKERVEVSKRCYKMALHIAMLRKQLADLGVDPADITLVILEFELNVHLNNSVQNLTGQAIWLDETSGLHAYLPDYHEYDKKGPHEKA